MHVDPANADPKSADRLTFVGRPAESVLKDCFAKLGGAQQ